MRWSSARVAPARLLAMFVLLAGLLLAVLGVLGWRLLKQDRALEKQRPLERLQDEAIRAIAYPESELPPGTVWLLFDARGVIERRGVLLPYYPAGAPAEEDSADWFASAEAVERTSPSSALKQYRELATSSDSAVRAGALLRLARTHHQMGNDDAALATYAELIALGTTLVAGDPAELVGRRRRAELLDSAGNVSGAAAERQALASLLAEGRYAIDGTTYTFYRERLPDVKGAQTKLVTELEKWWPSWKATAQGRQAWTEGDTLFATAWTTVPQGTVAVLTSSSGSRLNSQDAPLRRNLLVAGFSMMVLVILVAGYVTFRALLRELNVARLQSDFVAQVSHEFRTPLTAMCHLTELLEEGTVPQKGLTEFHRALGKETRRLHAMVESLLDFGRIESGRQVYRLEDTSLADIARQVITAVGSPRLRLVISNDAARSRIDRDALTLAVRNLVDNAMKYSTEPSPVTVSVGAQDGEGSISVEDCGAGMTPAEQRDVRRKFIRGTAARTMNVKGTGIGLAIVDQVAQAHGGRLHVDSTIGQGSRFTIWVPLSEPA